MENWSLIFQASFKKVFIIYTTPGHTQLMCKQTILNYVMKIVAI